MNIQRIKLYLGNQESVQQVIETYYIDEVLLIKRSTSCRDVKSSSTWEATQGVNLANHKFPLFIGYLLQELLLFSD